MWYTCEMCGGEAGFCAVCCCCCVLCFGFVEWGWVVRLWGEFGFGGEQRRCAGRLTSHDCWASPFSSMPMQGEHSASSLSPDSCPATGYSMSSVSSMPYAGQGSMSHIAAPFCRVRITRRGQMESC
ncbi:hypothetical protein DFP72DRAFT_880749 [Ephemerocybe angulata]|uniref:Uncharacterized protein n=1 Tax=Ephemerocybe angulata TaxID=980116 RepID=A0A8H6I9C0_9AGAR|nr:hypothetical protein DFP72DRAFT_880749 [Tulosesus angulatus]